MGDYGDGPRFQPPVRPEVCSHAGTMCWDDDEAWCLAPTCRQRWEMAYDPSGRRRGWVPTGRSSRRL